MKLGEDLSGGLFRRLMVPSNPAGLWYALAVAVGLMVIHQLLQLGLAMGFLLLKKTSPWFRVTVIDAAGKRAWSNPIWWDEIA